MAVTQAKITVTANSTAVQSHVNTERKAHLQWKDLNISILCCYYKHESVFDHSEYNSVALFNLLPADEITVYQQTLAGDTKQSCFTLYLLLLRDLCSGETPHLQKISGSLKNCSKTQIRKL